MTEKLPEIVVGEEVPDIAARIMRAAIHLFSRKGYAATSVREIVQHADVTNPMLYYYFESKEGLYTRLLIFLFETHATRVSVVRHSQKSFLEKLEDLIFCHFDGIDEEPQILSFIYGAIFGPDEGRPSFDIHEVHNRKVADVEAIIEEGTESGALVLHEDLTPSQAASFLIGLVNHHLMQSLKDAQSPGDPEVFREQLLAAIGPESRRLIRDFFLRGAGTLPESQ